MPLSYVLNLVGVSPQAKFVVFFPFDETWDSLDLSDALHPQTLLAYGMNGNDLPTPTALRCVCASRANSATRA